MSRRMLWTLVLISFISLVELAKISSVVDPNRRNVPVKNQLKTGKTIVTRLGLDGNPEQECECVKADLCNRADVIQHSATGERINCGKNSVCCIKSLSKESPSSRIQLRVNASEQTEKLNKSCDCIPCLIQQLLATEDELENFSLPDCELQNECCPGGTELPPSPTFDPKPTSQNLNPESPSQNLDPESPPQNLDPESPPQNIEPESPLQNPNPEFPSQNFDPESPPQNLDPESPPQNLNPESPSQNLNPESPSQNFDPESPSQNLNPESPSQNFDPESPPQNLDPESPSQNLDPESPSQNLDPESPPQNLDPESPSQNLDPESPSQNLDPESPPQNLNPESPSQNLNPESPSQNFDPEPQSPNLGSQPPSQNLYPQPTFQPFKPKPTSQNRNQKPTSQSPYPKSTTPNPIPFTPDQSSNSFECGIRRPGFSYYTPPMTGNLETSFGEFPWMALLLTSLTAPDGTTTDNIFVCGASIISPTIILTAAHCVSEVNIANLKVRAGEYNALEDILEPAPHQDREVNNIRIHPNYDAKQLFNDLALLTLTEPFNLTDHIYPICTPLINNQWASATYDTKSCVTTGWGKSTFGKKRVIYLHELLTNYMVPEDIYHTTLRKVDQCIIPRDYCENYFQGVQPGSYFQLHPSFICAVGQFGNNNICEGDGGGPLICPLKDNPNRYVQVGVVSWGSGCENGLPRVYASLEANLEWLSQEYGNLIAGSL